EVLDGPRTPTWDCAQCGHRANWASRLVCKGCGHRAPVRVAREAREAARLAQTRSLRDAKIAAFEVVQKRLASQDARSPRKGRQQVEQQIRKLEIALQTVQKALSLHREMNEAGWGPNVIGCSAVISACEKAARWQWALALLRDMSSRAELKPDKSSATYPSTVWGDVQEKRDGCRIGPPSV
ncbi:unnamed protein product, partial [Prorocentrum cordatum]